jgi:hypothetical protein
MLCRKWTKRCKAAREPLPKSYQRVDEPFVVQEKKEVDMEEMMAQMNSMGLGANMYSAAELRGSIDEEDNEDEIFEDSHDFGL